MKLTIRNALSGLPVLVCLYATFAYGQPRQEPHEWTLDVRSGASIITR
jgi:hypothetical protein